MGLVDLACDEHIGQFEGDGQPVMVCFQMDFRSEPAAGTSGRLARLPPFCSSGGNMGADHGTIEHLHQMRRVAQPRQHGKIVLESTRLAQSVEPFPNGVPVAEPFRQRPQVMLWTIKW